MTANFWVSTHYRNWLIPQTDLSSANKKDKAFLSDLEIKKLRIYFADWIAQLCSTLNIKLRQRVVATATVYFKRFFLRNNFVEFEPALVGATCVYLASKIEECSVRGTYAQDINMKANAMPGGFIYSANDLLQCEIYLVEALNCDLLVFHPYSFLEALLVDAGMEHFQDTVWKVLNDSYRTEVSLFYAPHIIGLGCIYLVCSESEPSISDWLFKLNTDLTQVSQVVVELLAFYEIRGHPSFDGEVQRILKERLPRIVTSPKPIELKPPPVQPTHPPQNQVHPPQTQQPTHPPPQNQPHTATHNIQPNTTVPPSNQQNPARKSQPQIPAPNPHVHPPTQPPASSQTHALASQFNQTQPRLPPGVTKRPAQNLTQRPIPQAAGVKQAKVTKKRTTTQRQTK